MHMSFRFSKCETVLASRELAATNCESLFFASQVWVDTDNEVKIFLQKEELTSFLVTRLHHFKMFIMH